MAHASQKGRRTGQKYAGTHTSVIPAAEPLCDFLCACPAVKKISLGFITSGLRSSGVTALKIVLNKSFILLTVRGNISTQQIRIYPHDNDEAKQFIVEAAKKKGFRITFHKSTE